MTGVPDAGVTPRGVPAHARERPDAVAVIDGGQRMTYAGLHAAAARLSHALHRLGAAPGERVAVMVPNSAAYLVAGTGCGYAGVSFIPVNWHLKADELRWILADSGARVLLVDAALAGYAAEAARDLAGCRVVTVGMPAVEVPGALDLEEAVRDCPDDVPDEAPVTPSWMFYTSGTTGRPKGVVHAMGGPQVMAAAQDGLCALWGFTGSDVYLLCGPGYHAGPGGYAFTTLYAGGTVVVQHDWDAAAWFRLVAEHGVTVTFVTPAHLIRLLEVPAEQRRSTRSLRLVIHAGAPCPTPVKEAALDLLAPAEVSELYGASEGGATRITAAEWRQRPGSVGRPWPGVEVRILDDTGAAVATGEDGLVYVRPARGARFSYHRDDEKTSRAWQGDAFTVGDIGHLDADGYLYITDRASDLVLWGGVNVYPREIEEVLHRHPAVVDCAVVGVPHERDGERLAALVETRSPLTEDELRDHVRGHLADFKVPHQIWFVTAVPRDPNGKVRKKLLRAELAAGQVPTGSRRSGVT